MAEAARNRYAEMLAQEYDAYVIREGPDVNPVRRTSVGEVQNLLKHYGYLDYEALAQEAAPELGTLDDVTVHALAEFQRRYNIGTPATLDTPTREFMAASRCGVPDLVDGPSLFLAPAAHGTGAT